MRRRLRELYRPPAIPFAETIRAPTEPVSAVPYHERMNPLLLIIVLLLLFGGGGFYFGGPAFGGGAVGLIVLICVIMLLTGGFKSR